MKVRKLFIVGLFSAMGLLASCASNIASNSSSTTSIGSTTSVSSELRVFTLAELAEYNGDNGSTAYVAVNGIVYDVTDVSEWENGWHKGMHLAGTDATAVFAESPHSNAFLQSLTIVGTLAS
ncbi:MAG: cytochrome b5 domain-containing protein [Bacilli bacterium]